MSTNDFGLQSSIPTNGESVLVEQCGDSEFESLSKYREKRTEWLRWYSHGTDEPNNIQDQICWMIFRDLSYRVLANPRCDVSDDVVIAARNSTLAHMLDEGYVATQVLAIRRLLDKRNDVLSIRRLLDDIKKNHKLITRKNFVTHDGLPYDPAEGLSESYGDDAQIGRIEPLSSVGFHHSTDRHEKFDKLSRVQPSERDPGDLIHDEIFNKLKKILDSAEPEKLVELSHKFFAHAATMKSMESCRDFVGGRINIEEIEVAQKAILSVERAITDDILLIGVYRDVVAILSIYFFKGLDAVYVPKEAIAEMIVHWKTLESDRNKWSDGYKDDLYAR